jgi:imidazole glycerol phosphate synthase subunit HisF
MIVDVDYGVGNLGSIVNMLKKVSARAVASSDLVPIRYGMTQGDDKELARKVAEAVRAPVVACSGAGSLSHAAEVIKDGHTSAAAAGSMFVFQGPLRGVLIRYPSPKELKQYIA